jgi:hypothetical protein
MSRRPFLDETRTGPRAAWLGRRREIRSDMRETLRTRSTPAPIRGRRVDRLSLHLRGFIALLGEVVSAVVGWPGRPLRAANDTAVEQSPRRSTRVVAYAPPPVRA